MTCDACRATQSLPFISHWIRHHAPLFDRVLMVEDGAVTDGSREVALAEAPGYWVSRMGPLVDSHLVKEGLLRDNEGEEWEPPGAWRIELAPNEFLVHPDPRALAQAHIDAASAAYTVNAGGPAAARGLPRALRVPCYFVEHGDEPLPKRFTSPLLQRTRILVPTNGGESRIFSAKAGRAGVDGEPPLEAAFVARFGGAPPPLSGAGAVDLRVADVSGASRLCEASQDAQSAWYRFFAFDAPISFA